jgi:predicted aminopeptidase
MRVTSRQHDTSLQRTFNNITIASSVLARWIRQILMLFRLRLVDWVSVWYKLRAIHSAPELSLRAAVRPHTILRDHTRKMVNYEVKWDS